MPLINKARYLLALHSSSENFGVAVIDLKDPNRKIKHAIFPGGRKLSNNIFTYIESLIPSKYWSQIARISVAKGPGGFTGTRLTVAIARTLAQQLDCSLDGISSFSLMAPRLAENLSNLQRKNAFWIIKKLERRGKIGGKYQITTNQDDFLPIELKEPFLLPLGIEVEPAVYVHEDLSKDIVKLIEISLLNHQKDIKK